jgi:hypothetical protein
MLTSNVTGRRKFFYLEFGRSSFLLNAVLFYQNTCLYPEDWAESFTETTILPHPLI